MMEASVYKKVLKAYRQELPATYTNKNCCEEMEGKISATRTEIVPCSWKVRVEISTEVMAKSFLTSFTNKIFSTLSPSQAGYSTV